MVLFVGNLPFNTTKEELEEHFSKTGMYLYCIVKWISLAQNSVFTINSDSLLECLYKRNDVITSLPHIIQTGG